MQLTKYNTFKVNTSGSFFRVSNNEFNIYDCVLARKYNPPYHKFDQRFGILTQQTQTYFQIAELEPCITNDRYQMNFNNNYRLRNYQWNGRVSQITDKWTISRVDQFTSIFDPNKKNRADYIRVIKFFEDMIIPEKKLDNIEKI